MVVEVNFINRGTIRHKIWNGGTISLSSKTDIWIHRGKTRCDVEETVHIVLHGIADRFQWKVIIQTNMCRIYCFYDTIGSFRERAYQKTRMRILCLRRNNDCLCAKITGNVFHSITRHIMRVFGDVCRYIAVVHCLQNILHRIVLCGFWKTKVAWVEA